MYFRLFIYFTSTLTILKVFCESKQLVKDGFEMIWLGWVSMVPSKKRERKGDSPQELFIFSLKHNALKHHNWLQLRRKLCHCHKDPTGCRTLLFTCSENNVTTFQWPAGSCCLPLTAPGLFGRKTFSCLPHVAVPLPAQSCIAQRAGWEGGADFQVDAQYELFGFFSTR